jgi:23S rRNA-/tRNA-specific pseudouridylate synthase
VVSEVLEGEFEAMLLHRLDKDTSGVLILVKNEEFRLKAIEEFKKHRVYKEYEAIVYGHLYEETKIDAPISTEKGKKAKSKIDKFGQSALTLVEPIAIAGKKTHVKVVIETGRTHQIRLHLAHINHPILGDTMYGGKVSPRMMLHAKRIKLFDYNFIASVPVDFKHLMGAD